VRCSTVLWPFRGIYCLYPQGRKFIPVSNQQDAGGYVCWLLCSVYSSTLKMEVVCCSETLVSFCVDTQFHIPELVLFSPWKVNALLGLANKNVKRSKWEGGGVQKIYIYSKRHHVRALMSTLPPTLWLLHTCT
jgi:hypothetical protein